ncbi:MAG: hypothetical protein Q7W05_15575 [Deltaproteobacteria bacterium]|nr:hypothetical protein [Deltaproteobacteria bacterium]
MNGNNSFYTKLFLTLLAGLLIPLLLLFTLKLKPVTTPQENELATFSYKPVSITAQTPPSVYAALECPVMPPPKKSAASPSTKIQGYPPVPLSAFAQKRSAASAQKSRSAGIRLSMIYYDGERRMAIINGNVLKEGDSTPNGTVTKIERNRVMIRTAGREQWLTIE